MPSVQEAMDYWIKEQHERGILSQYRKKWCVRMRACWNGWVYALDVAAIRLCLCLRLECLCSPAMGAFTKKKKNNTDDHREQLVYGDLQKDTWADTCGVRV